MLATILKSKVSTQVSIAIMDTFVKMRHYIHVVLLLKIWVKSVLRLIDLKKSFGWTKY